MKMEMWQRSCDSKEIIKRLGGPKNVATLLAVPPATVYVWNARGIPKYAMRFLMMVRPKTAFGVSLAEAYKILGLKPEYRQKKQVQEG